MSWQDELLPASWRGVPFGVIAATIAPGRQTAEHDYPYRDTVWVEDMGRARRPYRITGFLVEGDPFAGGMGVFAQRDLMVAACETPGPGVLVHPSLGARTVALVRPCEMNEGRAIGGAIELAFEFVETAAGPLYPATASDTASQVDGAGDNVDDAASTDMSNAVAAPVQTGDDAVAMGVTTVSGFGTQASTLVGRASVLANAVAGVPGYVGRYVGGGRALAQPSSATVASLLAASTSARTAVSAAAAAAVTAAAAL